MCLRVSAIIVALTFQAYALSLSSNLFPASATGQNLGTNQCWEAFVNSLKAVGAEMHSGSETHPGIEAHSRNEIHAGNITATAGQNAYSAHNIKGVIYLDGIKYTTLRSALTAACAALGGVVHVEPHYMETLVASVTIPNSNCAIIFDGPATITMGRNQLIGAAGTDGISVIGPYRGSATANHSSAVVFLYTGGGAALQFGGSITATFDLHLERIGVDITGAENTAQGIQVNRSQNVTIKEVTVLGKQASGTTQICEKFDGTGGFSAYQSIEEPYILGCHIGIDFAGPAGGNNQNQVIGGYVTPNQTTDGIAVYAETGDMNNFFWPDLFSTNIGLRWGANAQASLALVRAEKNTIDVQYDFGAGTGGGGGITTWTRTTPTVVDNSGNNNNIASQFPTGYLSLFKNLRFPETSGPTLGGAGYDDCFASSTAHALECSYNGGSYYPVARYGADGTSSGTIALSSGSGSHTFKRAYSAAPNCSATDNTSAAAVKVTSTTIAVSVTGTGTDIISWVCTPSSN